MDKLEPSNFIKSIQALYQDAQLPAAMLDQSFHVYWCSDAAPAWLPGLSHPDGALALLREYDLAEIREEISALGSFSGFAPSHDLFTKIPFVICAFRESPDYLLLPAESVRKDAVERSASLSRSVHIFENHYRRPLSTIFSILPSLERQVKKESPSPEKEKKLRQLKTIEKNSYALLRSCQWISEYTKLTGGISPDHSTRLEIYDFFRAFFEAAGVMTAELGIPLTYELPRGMLVAVLDTDKLSLILCNLLSNACRYTREGNQLELRVRKSGEQLLVSVCDKGAGIAPEMMPRVFEPYFSADANNNPYAGNGLGLSIAQAAAGILGGALTLTSSLGLGTTAVLSIPINGNAQAPEPVFKADSEEYLADRFSLLRVALSDCL